MPTDLIVIILQFDRRKRSWSIIDDIAKLQINVSSCKMFSHIKCPWGGFRQELMCGR